MEEKKTQSESASISSAVLNIREKEIENENDNNNNDNKINNKVMFCTNNSNNIKDTHLNICQSDAFDCRYK